MLLASCWSVAGQLWLALLMLILIFLKDLLLFLCMAQVLLFLSVFLHGTNFCFEDLLCPDIASFVDKMPQVNDTLTEHSKIARGEVERIVKDSGAGSDQQLHKALQKKAKSILAMSPCSQSELSLFDALVGKSSEGRLMHIVEQMFPKPEQYLSPELVAQKMKTLIDSQQFKFASVPAQAKVRTVLKWLNRILNDAAPELDLAKDCELLLSISARFQFFCMCEHEEKKGKASKTVRIHGKDALDILVEACRAKAEAGTATLDDATPLAVYRWLASAEKKAQIDTIISAVDESLSKKPDAPAGAGGAPASSSTGSAAKKGKKDKKAAAGDDSEYGAAVKKTMGLFGC